MEIMEAVKKRRSIRSFADRPIPPKILEELKDALVWAPSAGNLQSRLFYFIFNQQMKQALVETALHQFFIAEAPLVVGACIDLDIEQNYGKRGRDLYSIQDVSASIQNLLLVAHTHGLGTCWIGAFKEEEAARIIGIPCEYRIVSLVPVGYPAEDPPAPPRNKKKDAILDIY
jgi:nitroreductase